MLDNKLKCQILQSSKKFEAALYKEIGPTWFKALESEITKPSFSSLNDFLVKERNGTVPIYPPLEEVWSWTQFFDIADTKVVILGQDPYHGPNQAHGLCFSVKKGVAPPPSLINMYKELESDPGVDGFKRPNHGDLTGWAKQGVLLLNACLTVRKATPNSHKDKVYNSLLS